VEGKKVVYAKFMLSTANVWTDPIFLSTILDYTPPRISIKMIPALKSVTNNNDPLNIEVQARDNMELDRVEFYVDGKQVLTDKEAPYVYQWIPGNGLQHSVLCVRAYDKAGNKSETQKDLPLINKILEDIPSNYWAVKYINELKQNGIVNGYSDESFRPDKNMTRAEFIKMICVAKGWPIEENAVKQFKDVKKSHWAYAYINTAVANGITNGYRNDRFQPDANISRAEISKILALSSGYNGTSANNFFTDIKDSWARDYILSCAKHGVISGYPDGKFRPQKPATRAETAKMVANILQ
jgi:hypothetical protein